MPTWRTIDAGVPFDVMNPESPQTPQWADIQALLTQALELPPAARGPWLRNLPPEYDAVREILRRLLEERAQLDGVSLSVTSSEAPDASRMDPLIGPGDLIGPYRILRELGSGGMGSVWLAERADGQLRRKFALKLPRLAWVPDLAARVASERDILVSLEHPNIARLYDAGVDDQGRPFLAIEYVEGQRIDVYCDEKRLNVRERVTLFKQIVDAVQYAHTQLVIHRDLKPANVLVNSRGKAILLDFGIASLLAEAQGADADPVLLTVSRAMTPRFASPEQLQGVRLSLTSDVYSLGVMMYDLLVGSTPYRTQNPTRSEFERAVIEGDIRAPSESEITVDIAARRNVTPERLARQLGGDLDAIVRKAMQLNPQARYPSVEAMAADLERWLTGHPVLAAPPSRLNRCVKFTRRNPIPVGLGAAASVLITLSTAIAVMQFVQAKTESRRANATNAFLLEMFDYANPELHGGRDITARELLLEGEKRIASTLRDQPEVKAAVFSAISDVWVRLGDLERTELLLRERLSELKQLGTHSEVQKATVDLAYVSIARSELENAKKTLDDLDTAGPIESATTKATYLWIRGWLALSEGQQHRAETLFKESFDAASDADESLGMIRALYGSMQVNVAKHNSSAVVTEFDRATTLLAQTISDPGEYLRRKFELVSALYAVGEYQKGWPHIQDLIERSVVLYGPYAASQSSLRHEWMNWSAQQNYLDEVVKWIESSETEIEGVRTTAVNIDDYSRLLMEARAFSLAGKIKRSMTHLDVLRGKSEIAEGYPLVMFRTIESEVLIRSGRTQEAIAVLFDLENSVEKTILSDIDRMYISWNRGIAELKLGEREKARRSLEDAERAAINSFGAGHPRVNLIFMARLIATEKTLINGAERIRFVKAVESLKKSYPVSHPLMVSSAALLDELMNDKKYSQNWEKLREMTLF